MDMRHLPLAIIALLLTACDLGLETYNLDTGEDPAVGDAPPYGGDTEINEEDTGTSSDTDDTDSKTDTGTKKQDEEHNPELSLNTVTDSATTLTVPFNLSDADGDLNGGTLLLTFAGEETAFSIPGDFNTWNDGGRSEISIDIDPCQIGTSPTLKLRATDSTGRNSNVIESVYTFTTAEITVDTGSGNDGGNIYTTLGSGGVDIGSVPRPAVICGNIYAAGNDGTVYTGDLDYLDLRTSFGGNTDFTLTWEVSADYDLYLYNGNTGTNLGAGITDGQTQPEAFTASLTSGQAYILLIGGWSGAAGDWKLTIE